MGAIIKYGSQETLLDSDKTMSLYCANKVFKSDIVISSIAENEEAKIHYNNSVLTTLGPEQVLTLRCAEYKANSNLVIKLTAVKESIAGTEGLLYTLSDDGTYYICSGIEDTATETNIIIANELNGIPVKVIGYEAFRERYNITSVVIPNNIITIEENAFYYCDGITHISFPDSLVTIGTRAFYWCKGLKTLKLGAELTTIESMAFYNCSNINTVIFGTNISYIGPSNFISNINIENIYYTGTAEQWNNITIDANNEDLTEQAEIHYNSSGPAN